MSPPFCFFSFAPPNKDGGRKLRASLAKTCGSTFAERNSVLCQKIMNIHVDYYKSQYQLSSNLNIQILCYSWINNYIVTYNNPLSGIHFADVVVTIVTCCQSQKKHPILKSGQVILLNVKCKIQNGAQTLVTNSIYLKPRWVLGNFKSYTRMEA